MAIHYPRCLARLSVVFDGHGGPDSAPVPVEVIPRQATVQLNGYKEASTWSVDFFTDKLSLSPELIRSAAVQIYMADMPAGAPVPPTATEDMVIAGLVDNASLHRADDGLTMRLDGRDYTAIMLDRQWVPKTSGHHGVIPAGEPLDKTVQALVDEASLVGRHDSVGNVRGRVLTVEFRGETPPIVGRGRSNAVKRGYPVAMGKSYWDAIYELCLSYGFIAFVRLDKVVISTPQALTKESLSRVKRVAYGRNLAMLEVERKLGKETTPQIVVVSWDPKTRKALRAVYPATKERPTTGVGTKKDEHQITTANGVTDEKVLRRIAETRYNNLARSEAKVRFATKSLHDLEGSDLLKLRPGDPVGVEIEPYNGEDMRRMTSAQRADLLSKRGYTREVAKLISEGYDRAERIHQPFYTREVTLEWSKDDGITIQVEAMNYIAAHRDEGRA